MLPSGSRPTPGTSSRCPRRRGCPATPRRCGCGRGAGGRDRSRAARSGRRAAGAPACGRAVHAPRAAQGREPAPPGRRARAHGRGHGGGGAGRPATAERTFGLLRLEILAALVNGAALLALSLGIAVEAVHRLREPPAVRGGLLLGIAALGLAANVAGAALLARGHRHSLNERGAFLHLVSDALGSLGALAAGAVVLATGWVRADPLISILISLLILGSAWRLVKESTDVLLEAAPAHIALAEVHDRIASIPGVASVHDLHLWTVTSGVIAMSGHLVVQDPAEHQRVLETVQRRLGELGIGHVTVQMERDPTCE